MTCWSIFSATVQANSLVVNQGSQLVEEEEHSACSALRTGGDGGESDEKPPWRVVTSRLSDTGDG